MYQVKSFCPPALPPDIPHVQTPKPPPSQPTITERERRKLPVMPKEKVLDEWAAVIRHQDEIAQNKKEKEIYDAKLQQEKYRTLLEEQIKLKRLESQNSKHYMSSGEHDVIQKMNEQTQVWLISSNS